MVQKFVSRVKSTEVTAADKEYRIVLGYDAVTRSCKVNLIHFYSAGLKRKSIAHGNYFGRRGILESIVVDDGKNYTSGLSVKIYEFVRGAGTTILYSEVPFVTKSRVPSVTFIS